MLWNAVIFGLILSHFFYHPNSHNCIYSLRPKDTPFEDGTFKLTIEFTEEYPNKPPNVRFVSKMFHPNGMPVIPLLFIALTTRFASLPPSLSLSLPSLYIQSISLSLSPFIHSHFSSHISLSLSQYMLMVVFVLIYYRTDGVPHTMYRQY